MATTRTSRIQAKKKVQEHTLHWLASWDFVDNPFGLWEAGQEPWLDRYFVRPSFFEELLTSPKSAVVFAPRGGGKSAMRIMVQAECRPAVPTSHILAVSFTDFSPFIEPYHEPPRVTLENYLPRIIATALPRVLLAIARISPLTLDFDPSATGRLRYWIDQYAPYTFTSKNLSSLLRQIEPDLDDNSLTALTSRIQRRIPPPVGLSTRIERFARFLYGLRIEQSISPNSPMDSPSQVMQAFIRVVLELLEYGSSSCKAIYLLIDGVDEYSLTQDYPQATANILRPLLSNLHFLEIPGLAVKFFLPAEQRIALERITRTDRLDVITLTWELPTQPSDTSRLRQLFRRRIAAFNTRGLVGLGEMCAAAMRRWIEDAMLEEAHDSPRNLLRLGNLLFSEHCHDLPEPESVILPTEWERALTRFRATPQEKSQPQSLLRSATPSTSSQSDIPRLQVNLQSGTVFIGGGELPPLTDLEYRLLAFLYRRKGQICTKDEIALAVYEPKYENAIERDALGISDAAISRLIYRLRQRIEPPDYDNPKYLKTIKGRGYRLDNTA